MFTPAVVHACRTATRVAAAVVLLIGSAGLSGWVFDVDILKALSPGGITIKANTAACLILLGTALLLLAREDSRSRSLRFIGRLLATVAMIIGGLTLAQHVFDVNFHIDTLIIREPPGEIATTSPGRMGVPASISFFLCGVALLLLDARAAVSQSLAAIVTLIALLPLIGYAYGIEPLYGISHFTAIAAHTAIAILVLSTGLLTARPNRGPMAVVFADDAGGMMARRLLLPAILLPLFLGWLRTIGARRGWIDDAFGRPMLVLSLIVSLAGLIWWNARAMAALGRERVRAEAERMRSDETVRDRERQMHLAQSAANLGTWELNLRTGNGIWSDGIWRLLGIPPGSKLTTLQSWLEHIHPDDRDRVRTGLGSTRPQRVTDFYREYRLIVTGGAGRGIRWVASKGQIVADESGQPFEAFGACYDITERRLAEEAVREGSERLQLGMEAGNTGTWDWDIPANRVTWSSRIYDFHGLTPENFGGRVEDFQKMIHPDDAERVGAAIKDSLENRTLYQVEFRVIHPTGEVRWLTTTGKVFYSTDGQPIRMMGATSDVTARKEAERERDELFERERAARAEAERASEAKSEFLATLSHELRTPLTPVLLTASLLESHPALPDDVRKDLATIRRNVELESRLIADLLDLTRITRGKLELDMHDVDLHLIIRAAADICQRESSAPLRLELYAPRPTVRGDSTRLTQIFWNLINNAQKFTPPDGAITIHTSNDSTREGIIRVSVTDTGVGIDPAVLPRLFNAFEQGEVRVARQQAGLGLGLSISRKLAEAHGGTVIAQSEGRNRGATFVVELPLDVDAPLTHAPATLPPARPIAKVAQVRPLNVLLVEDHPATLEVLTRLLEILGHKVTPATSVESARAASATQDAFDLLISDLGLPDGTGLDIMRHIGPRYAGRAIALTGYGMESDILATRSVGFAEHLIKPVDLAALQNAIARISG